MRRRGKTFLSLFLSAVIVTGQPVLAADFSAGEETFISETTEQEGDVSEASAIFEDTVDSDSEMRYEKYEATVSSEILDLGQTGVNGSGWGWERLEIKNTGTEAWHIKSISELNDFTLEPFDYPFQGRFPMEVGNKVKPGEAVAADIYVKKNLSPGIHEETFVMETEEGIQAKCRIRVLIRGASDQDYEVNCRPNSGTRFLTITPEEYDWWDNTDPDPDMFMCPKRSIWIYNNGKNPVTVDFENTEHFWAYLDDYETGVIMPGEGTTVYLRPKKEEQVATDIFKVSITGGIELSYIISQNCPHIAPPYPEGATI
ncbi:hypothetical protein, partial [Blautia obeum]